MKRIAAVIPFVALTACADAVTSPEMSGPQFAKAPAPAITSLAVTGIDVPEPTEFWDYYVCDMRIETGLSGIERDEFVLDVRAKLDGDGGYRSVYRFPSRTVAGGATQVLTVFPVIDVSEYPGGITFVEARLFKVKGKRITTESEVAYLRIEPQTPGDWKCVPPESAL